MRVARVSRTGFSAVYTLTMPRKKKGRRRTRRFLLWIAGVLAVVVGVSVALTLPLRWIDPPTTSFMLRDASGREPVLHAWIEWDRIGASAVYAVVAAEDQKFNAHFGIDVESIQSSIGDSRRGRSLRGASTISQQVAKNLYLWPGRSFLRKGLEAWFTVLLEAFLPKRRILEIYLNVAQFGPGIYGIAAASKHFFHRPPARLSDAEAALLAAVLPNPVRMQVERPSEYVRERQVWILGQMQRLKRERWLDTL